MAINTGVGKVPYNVRTPIPNDYRDYRLPKTLEELEKLIDARIKKALAAKHENE